MASHNAQLLAATFDASAKPPTRPARKKRKAADGLEAIAAEYSEEKKSAKKPRFVPLSADEMRSYADPDGTFVVTPTTTKNKASSLRRFVETVRRDPAGVGAAYLQEGGRVAMRLPHGQRETVQVFSKVLPMKVVGEDKLDQEITTLVEFMKKAGFNAAYPSFVQSFGYGKYARKSVALNQLAAAQAAKVKLEGGAKELEMDVEVD